MKTITITGYICFSLLVNAQEVVSTQGTTYSNASGTIDFTIGEVLISTGADGTNNVTQGFHQTNWNFLGMEDFAPEIDVSIFPNPTQDVLYINTKSFENVTYTLYDAQGKLIIQNKLCADITPVQVNQLAPGSYSLELIFDELNNGTLNHPKRKTFKLIKSQ